MQPMRALRHAIGIPPSREDNKGVGLYDARLRGGFCAAHSSQSMTHPNNTYHTSTESVGG